MHFLFTFFSKDFQKFLFCVEGSELQKRNLDNKRVFTFKRNLFSFLFTAYCLKKVCKKSAIDLIHIHDSHSLNYYIFSRFLGLKTPAVIHRHVNFEIKSFWKYKISGVLKIICVSDEVKLNFIKKIDEKLLVVIPPCIDVYKGSFSSARENKEEILVSINTKIIGTVSALEKEKNIKEFIYIAKELLSSNEDLFFIIFGEGSEREVLKRKIIEENLDKKILLVGYRENIQQDIGLLDLFLFTSKNEGFPLVLLEAMSSKIPIVSANSGGIKNMIIPKFNGLVYSSGDIKGAISEVNSILEDVTLKDFLVDNALNYVKQFDVPLINKKIEEMYNKL